MNSNESRTLWISLGSGLLAAFLIYSYSQEKKAEYDKTYGTLKNVVIARVDIAEMQTIDDTMLEISQRPSEFVETEAYSEPERAVGQVAAAPIKKGEQILRNKLLEPGPSTGIALQVAPSKRAVTMPVDEVRGVAKLIRPGDRVDIYAAVDTGKGVNQRREVTVIMQDVVILATGINVVNNIPRILEPDSSNNKNLLLTTLNGDTKYNTVTVEATPKEAQDLIYLMTTSPGNIYFTLRNPNDRVVPPRMPSSSSESVLGRPSASLDGPLPAAPTPQVAAPVRPAPAAPAPLPARKPSNFRDL